MHKPAVCHIHNSLVRIKDVKWEKNSKFEGSWCCYYTYWTSILGVLICISLARNYFSLCRTEASTNSLEMEPNTAYETVSVGLSNVLAHDPVSSGQSNCLEPLKSPRRQDYENVLAMKLAARRVL